MEYKQIWRFYVDTPVDAFSDQDVIELSNEEAHFAFSVLRLSPGESVELSDGRGWTARAALAQVDKKTVSARIQTILPQAPVTNKLIAVVGLTKPGALDEVIQACVESGVFELVLFKGERSWSKQEVKEEKIKKQIREMCRITKSPWCMKVTQCDSLHSALTYLAKQFQYETLLVCDERPAHIGLQTTQSQHIMHAVRNSHAHDLVFLVGPEASFSLKEYEVLSSEEAKSRAVFVSLGPRILRTPAAVAAASYTLNSVLESRLG